VHSMRQTNDDKTMKNNMAMRTMKKWVLTRVAHSTIIVESETDPTEDNWNLEQKYGKAFDEEYHNDGITEWECDTVENIYGETENYEVTKPSGYPDNVQK